MVEIAKENKQIQKQQAISSKHACNSLTTNALPATTNIYVMPTTQ